MNVEPTAAAASPMARLPEMPWVHAALPDTVHDAIGSAIKACQDWPMVPSQASNPAAPALYPTSDDGICALISDWPTAKYEHDLSMVVFGILIGLVGSMLFIAASKIVSRTTSLLLDGSYFSAATDPRFGLAGALIGAVTGLGVSFSPTGLFSGACAGLVLFMLIGVVAQAFRTWLDTRLSP